MTLSSYEPRTFNEAISSKDKGKWQITMEEEMESLHKNGTWKLIKKQPNTGLLGEEESTEGDPHRYKPRFVAKGYTQREWFYFNDIFSPVVKHGSIRVILAMVTQFGLWLKQMDEKTTFLHERLEERMLMKQHEGFKDKTKADWVCLL